MSKIASLAKSQKNVSPPNSLEIIDLPFDKDLEAVVLGACLIDNTATSIVKTVFTNPKAFYVLDHEAIFRAIMDLSERNKPVDILTTWNTLKTLGIQREIDMSLLVELTNRVASSANLEYHCRLLYQFYMRRLAIETCQQIIQEAKDQTKDIFDTYENGYTALKKSDPSGILKVRSVTDSAVQGSKQPKQKMMCGPMIRERDTCIFFGDEGTGKSIFAYQIADAVSRGVSMFPDQYGFINECAPKRTVVFDFEMLEREIWDRYSDKGLLYGFNENFFRASIDDQWLGQTNTAHKILDHIEAIVKQKEAQFIIIDNITWICEETTDNTIAGKIMKRLDSLRKSMSDLSIVVIAHTPKRDRSQPLESRHLAGGKSLSNFCTNLFAISESMSDPNVRYIKHLKCRGNQKQFTIDYVPEMVITKIDAMLKYELMGYGTEQEHLSHMDLSEQADNIDNFIVDLVEKNHSYRSIAKEVLRAFSLKMSHTTVKRRYDRYMQEKKNPQVF